MLIAMLSASLTVPCVPACAFCSQIACVLSILSADLPENRVSRRWSMLTNCLISLTNLKMTFCASELPCRV